MKTPIDTLLASYQQKPSDEAFRRLVSRHSGLVQGTATRLLGGNDSAADDVSQQVFLRLLKKAPSLPPRICLAGWLYRQTCRLSSDYRKSDSRRKAREEAAFNFYKMNEQETEVFFEGVDEALASLPEEDRNVILLRYFEEHSHRAVGDAMGISEEAARKRCARAVEALRAFFGRNGQAISTGTLGLLLAGLSTKPLSAGTLAKMLPQQAVLAPKSSPALSFLAGLMLGGCSAGCYLLIDWRPEPEASVEPARISERRMESGVRTISEDGGFQSLESVIARVRVLMRRPQNALREMELEALFDSLPVDQRGAFFMAAKDVFSIAEKQFCYTGFLKHWMEIAPEVAMDFCLAEAIGRQLGAASVFFEQNLFLEWARSDLTLSSDWLRRNWQNPALGSPATLHSLKLMMSHICLRQILDREGVIAAFEAARTFGDSEDFILVSEAITGTYWNQVRDDQGVEIYRYLINLPESDGKNALVKKFSESWKHLSFGSTESMINALKELEPSERLPLELSLLGEFPRETRVKELANGSTMIETIGEEPTEEERLSKREEREEAFRESARQAGLGREDANLMIAKYYLENEREDASRILKNLQPSTELDEEIQTAIRKDVSLRMRGSAEQELKAFEYVQHLSSDEERDALSRSLFRRIIVKNPHDARALLASPDLSPRIVEILKEVALKSSL